MSNERLRPLLDSLDGLLPETRDFYTDLHAHPELSNQEHRTAAHAAGRLTRAGFEVTTDVGTTGVVGVLRNGEGPTPSATDTVLAAFRGHFPDDQVQLTGPTSAGEDYGVLGRAWGAPAVFWFVGGVDHDTYDAAARDGRLGELPTNHSPLFAPALDPTVRTGVEALVTAAGARLAPDGGGATG
jgi:metal-dependent amidase/aminoacylase/carboxypeptidase family protein